MSGMNLPELGIGLTWFAGLEPVLEENAGLIDVLEVEPQTFCRRGSDPGTLVVDQPSLQSLIDYRSPKLVHSIGLPVGGTQTPRASELELLREVAVELDSPWLSEHLSFNRVEDDSGSWHTGFLLPPRQTLAGVDAAVTSIRTLSSAMPVPVAIETGVSYLQPRLDEIADGEFVARVTEAADCGILLDLHNIWTNQRNGRQPLTQYLEQLPLERVWELHLAGGSSHRGYWLDAHSGPVSDELMEIACRVVPRLPNLKAIVFELFPSYLPSVGPEIFRTQLEALHRLWDRRGTGSHAQTAPRARIEPGEADPAPSPRQWERALGALAAHRQGADPFAEILRSDPGIPIIREMVEQFRGSMIVRTLRLSSRLIMLERGPAYFEQLLAAFWKQHPPELFACDEAEAFTQFLREQKPYVPFLTEILEYDRAVIAVALNGEERLIPFRADPLPLLRALGAGRRPGAVAIGNFEVRLAPDEIGADTTALAQIRLIH
jgi:uncharacterized protein